MTTSCYAGAQDNNQIGTSLVEILANKLRGHGVGGLEIVGYKGPSIKSTKLRSFVKAVDDNQIDAAGDLQGDVLARSNPMLPYLTTGFGGNMEAKANTATTLSQNFYSDFVNELEQQQLLVSGEDIARICVVLD